MLTTSVSSPASAELTLVCAPWCAALCHAGPVIAVVLVLGLLLCVALGVIAWLTAQLADARELHRAPRVDGPSQRRPAVPAHGAGGADGRAGHATAVETVSRMREQGVRSTLLASIDDFTRWALEDRGEIARVAGPDGEVTIFFSDIENSTALNSELGDEEWVRLLAAHDKLLHTYVEKHRGHDGEEPGRRLHGGVLDPRARRSAPPSTSSAR